MRPDAFVRRLSGLHLKLTREQMKAVTHDAGPLLVHAGPGSGKTAVITSRCAFLCWECGVRPEQIAVFTFTRKSAAELRERLGRIDPLLTGVHAGTFHSLFLRWLLHAGKENPRLMSAAVRQKLLAHALGAIRMPARRETVEEFERHLALVTASVPSATGQRFDAAVQLYTRLKTEQELWDFDDILVAFRKHLATDAEFSAALAGAVRHLMVDEFQDTNPIEWECLRTLAKAHANIAAVGDDDQCIYRFRGAAPDLFQHFRVEYPGVREVRLRHNFRSTDPVVALSQRLIRHSRERSAESALVSAVGAGPRPTWSTWPDAFAEARHVARETARERRRRAHTVGILARTHQQLTLVAEALRGVGVAFQPTGQSTFLYDQPYVAPVVRLLRAAARSVACGRAYADYLRWIGSRERASEAQWSAASCEQLAVTLRDEPMKPKTWDPFARLLRDLATLPPQGAVDQVLALYIPYLKRVQRSTGVDLDTAFRALDALVDRAAAAVSLASWLEELDLLYHRAAPASAHETGGVRLLTFHGAKGLEFDCVFVIGVQEGWTPHARALPGGRDGSDREANLDDERRLLYVALTRARTELHLSSARRTGYRDAVPSRFAAELGFTERSSAPRRPVVTAAATHPPVLGGAVSHRVFGSGIISSVEEMLADGHKVGIMFNGRDMRYFYWESAVQAEHIVSRPAAEEGSPQ